MADESWSTDKFLQDLKNWGIDISGTYPTAPQDEKHLQECFDCRAGDYSDEALGILISKHKDYGPTNISDAPGGALNGLRVRLHDKVARLNNLVDKGTDPNHESLYDTFLDIANYGIIGMMILNDDWDKK